MMAAILLALIAALCACIIFSKKIHETLPPAVFTVTLSVYLFALILPLSTAIFITAGAVVIVLAIILLVQRKNIKVTIGTPFYILIVVSVIFCAFLSNRHVFYYDDLSYWALYTKNIFSIGHLPSLFENCSVSYKDYTPIMQILQYIAMFGRKTFSEDTMFRTNVTFIYVLLLPMLSVVFDTPACSESTGSASGSDSPVQKHLPVKIAAVILYVIFPHVLTAQFYYRLGVDLFVALVFGYALYIIFKGEHDLFSLICLTTSLSFLALVKTSGIVLCIFAILIFITTRSTVIRTLIISVFTFGSYFSWQLFLRYSWNNGYLSDRVKSGITGGGFAFPEYTKEVITNYIVHFFTYPLTRNRIGVTAALLVLFIIIVQIFTSSKKSLFVSSLIGFVLFCVAHTSMYLFIFDEWEAHGLLEFDRYITQYLGGLTFVYACILLRSVSDDEEKTENKSTEKNARRNETILYASVAAFLILLPYADIMQYLLPSGYANMYESAYASMADNAKSEWEKSGIDALQLSHDGSERLTMIANSWDETTQFLEYTAVPQPIDRILNVPAVDEGMIVSLADDYLEQYLYVAENAPAAYVGNWDETASLTVDQKPLEKGGLYRVVRDGDDKLLEPVAP